MEPMPLGRFVELASGGATRLELAATGGAVVVELGPSTATDPDLVASLPLVIVGVGDPGQDPEGPGRELADVVVGDLDAAAEVVAAVERRPVAAAALALLLREAERRPVPAGLVAESSTYSLLQAGPEHKTWLQNRGRPQRPPRPGVPAPPGLDPGPEPVLVQRDGRRLRVTLNRPAVHNAFDAAMRDALLDALAVAAEDPEVEVVVDGAGPSFCSGGDLDEFGTRRDPASAHLLRLGRSVGYALHRLAGRVTVEAHGHCIGSGLELAAFAGRVTVAADTTFGLPELAMGLVPGAGGTVSITRRIGRHRTAWLALTGARLTAGRALAWRLVDEVRPVGPRPS